MSRLPAQPSSVPGGRPSFSLQARGLEVIEKLGYLPSELTGALRVRVADLVLHQRLETGKRVGVSFPSRRKAQKRFFARSFQYSRKAEFLRELQGESFIVGGEADPAKRGRDFWDLLQTGGVIRSSGAMFIPFSPASARAFAKAGFGDVINQGRARGLLAVESGRAAGRGFRSELVGVLRRTRRQPKLLQWFESFDTVYPRHAAQMDRVVEEVLTAEGRARVAQETERLTQQVAARLTRVYGASDRGTRAEAVRRGEKIGGRVRLSPAPLGLVGGLVGGRKGAA